MRKIDLHVHTVPTDRDSYFEFSIDTLKWYVEKCDLDIIAITNHNIFDLAQFRHILNEIPITVFPGIEINVGSGHLLLIADGADLIHFDTMCRHIKETFAEGTESIDVIELTNIFGDLSEYIIIPHYEKDPPIKGKTLSDLSTYICAGEVDSVKKFVRVMKDDSKLSPVLFSDSRMEKDMKCLPTRQTYIDCGEISYDALKACLKEKRKIFLTKKDGNRLFQVFEDGQHISTGLNVLLGDRSTGKTYTLDWLNRVFENVKYIKQFELVQADEGTDEKEFKNDIQLKRSGFIDQYLSEFKLVLDDVARIDIRKNKKDVEEYVKSLLASAEEVERRDEFSKVRLFDEVEYSISNNDGLKKLIKSVIYLVDNIEYRSIIERHIRMETLKNLALELIKVLWGNVYENKKRNYVNAIVRDVRDGLKIHTSATLVANVDLYRIALEKRKVNRFNKIVDALQEKTIIFSEDVKGFRVVAEKGKYCNASEMGKAIKGKVGFKELLPLLNDNPYDFLISLMEHDKVNEADIYKLFAKITYKILNSEGNEVSGGERSEFRLLQKIKDAQDFDLLLIDEPESSFDNIFLKNDVNQIIRDISESVPVVVVTHNSTVGATIKPNYIIYAKKTVTNGIPTYRLYSGYATDKTLCSVDGLSINNHTVLMDSLEGGKDAYEERKEDYKNIES